MSFFFHIQNSYISSSTAHLIIFCHQAIIKLMNSRRLIGKWEKGGT